MGSETTTIVIMGASGDLTQRKLLPALFHLACKGRLPAAFHIVGFARSAFSDEEFRQRMWQGVEEFSELAGRTEDWEPFAGRISFWRGRLE